LKLECRRPPLPVTVARASAPPVFTHTTSTIRTSLASATSFRRRDQPLRNIIISQFYGCSFRNPSGHPPQHPPADAGRPGASRMRHPAGASTLAPRAGAVDDRHNQDSPWPGLFRPTTSSKDAVWTAGKASMTGNKPGQGAWGCSRAVQTTLSLNRTVVAAAAADVRVMYGLLSAAGQYTEKGTSLR